MGEEDVARSNVLYSYRIDLGSDSGAVLLGILYRSPLNNKEWEWTIVEEKNFYSQLITNNLPLIYDDKVISNRPHDRKKKFELTAEDEKQYIIDSKISKLSIGIGWELTTSPMDECGDDKDKMMKQKL